jgi:hypothetical protein
VWHRDPRGVWTFYSTINPDLGCSRYFGAEITDNVVTPIGIEWNGPAQFRVNIGTALLWEVRLTESSSTRLMNAAGRLVPGVWANEIHAEGDGCRRSVRVRNGKNESCRKNTQWP